MYNCLIGLFLTALQVTCDIAPESANVSQEECLSRETMSLNSWEKELVSNVHGSSPVAVLIKIPKSLMLLFFVL